MPSSQKHSRTCVFPHALPSSTTANMVKTHCSFLTGCTLPLSRTSTACKRSWINSVLHFWGTVTAILTLIRTAVAILVFIVETAGTDYSRHHGQITSIHHTWRMETKQRLTGYMDMSSWSFQKVCKCSGKGKYFRWEWWLIEIASVLKSTKKSRLVNPSSEITFISVWWRYDRDLPYD